MILIILIYERAQSVLVISTSFDRNEGENINMYSSKDTRNFNYSRL